MPSIERPGSAAAKPSAKRGRDADCGEDDVCSVPLTAFEMATTEVTVGLHVADHGLDCRATPEFAFDGAEDAALLTGDEDPIGLAVSWPR